jgi:hypothetical protein
MLDDNQGRVNYRPIGKPNGNYDFDSIMHYAANNPLTDGRVLTPLLPRTGEGIARHTYSGGSIGNTKELSVGDKQAARFLAEKAKQAPQDIYEMAQKNFKLAEKQYVESYRGIYNINKFRFESQNSLNLLGLATDQIEFLVNYFNAALSPEDRNTVEQFKMQIEDLKNNLNLAVNNVSQPDVSNRRYSRGFY